MQRLNMVLYAFVTYMLLSSVSRHSMETHTLSSLLVSTAQLSVICSCPAFSRSLSVCVHRSAVEKPTMLPECSPRSLLAAMATKNSTLLVTTLLTQTRDRTAEDILFQTGRKESGNSTEQIWRRLLLGQSGPAK